MKKMKDLMKRARRLGSRTNTEWAETHEDSYRQFANDIAKEYVYRNITGAELEELALTAFHDFSLDNLKDYEEVL